jgi:hypothetical protein
VTADKDYENILAKEVESWKGFEYALCNPNASLFDKMLKECLENEEYAEAFKTKGPQYSRVLVYGFNIPAAENNR